MAIDPLPPASSSGSVDPALGRLLEGQRQAQPVQQIRRGEDVAELSDLARALSKDDQATGVRHALVERIRRQLADPNYEQAHLDEAIRQLLRDLRG